MTQLESHLKNEDCNYNRCSQLDTGFTNKIKNF